MGAVSRDIHKNAREYDDLYTYTDEGIAVLLKDIYRLNESRWYKGDIDATAIIADLKTALDSDCLTPRMRQVVALYYFVGLTEGETANILGIAERKAINKALNASLERIAEQMSEGSFRKKGHAEIETGLSTPLFIWLTAVAYRKEPIYKVPAEVFTEILINSETDINAKETLRQREEGSNYMVDYSETEEYPALSEDQFKWKDRRMAFKPEIFPRGDVTGSRKVAIKLRDGDNFGNEWVLDRRKLYARGGN